MDKNDNQQGKNPLVTFIITAYNIPTGMLLECIKSILALSLSNNEREIILVDDGSDVPPLSDLYDVIDNIIYMRQSNQGLSVARNVGIQTAKGKYIQFVDGDDALIQAPYEHCIDIVRYHDPDIVIFNETDDSEPEISFEFGNPVSGTEYLHNNNLHAAACMYVFKKSLLLNLRFTPNILHEDEEFTPQLFLRAEKIYATNAKAYFYRRRESSITQEVSTEHCQRRLTDTRKVIYHLQEIADKLPENDRVALQRRIAQLCMDYLYNTMRLTGSSSQLEEAVDDLRQHGLFPLPDKNYTKKYKLFRKTMMTRAGRWIMLRAISKI